MQKILRIGSKLEEYFTFMMHFFDRQISLINGFTEKQCNTGGLVDPAFGYRVPLEVARDKGLIDPRVAGLLNPQTSEQKAYTDPNTGKNCTYDEMMQKCTKRNNVLLLPIDDRNPQIQTHQMIFN